jgi:hypothetical protein
MHEIGYKALRRNHRPYSINIFDVPAPQSFDITVPTTISNGVPAAGAGNIETKASEDRYSFAVQEGQSLYLDRLSGSHSWSLTNTDTATTVGRGSTLTDRQFNDLAGGTYMLMVKSSPYGNTTGAYSISIF